MRQPLMPLPLVQWLTYWVVFSALETAEAVIEQLMW
jgi:hypothetical protein